MSLQFNTVVFGPIKSRRLGNSLGVNLLPAFGKVCNFDCIYCECGWNKDGRDGGEMPAKEIVRDSLESRLIQIVSENIPVDSITFSGNGEPTLHPQFSDIIDDVIDLRDKYLPGAKITVLSNGGRIDREDVKNAMLKVDNPVIKLDSANDKTANLIDRPQFEYRVCDVLNKLAPFAGRFVLQTMFIRGIFDGVKFDNTTKEELTAWYDFIDKSRPRDIMVYTTDRDTPSQSVEKISEQELNNIAAPLVSKGYKVIIAG